MRDYNPPQTAHPTQPILIVLVGVPSRSCIVGFRLMNFHYEFGHSRFPPWWERIPLGQDSPPGPADRPRRRKPSAGHSLPGLQRAHSTFGTGQCKGFHFPLAGPKQKGPSSAGTRAAASHAGQHQCDRVGVLHRREGVSQRKTLAPGITSSAGWARACWWPNASFAECRAIGRFPSSWLRWRPRLLTRRLSSKERLRSL